jgi:hypothetical protein
MDFISMIDDIGFHGNRFALSLNGNKMVLELADKTMDGKYPETTDLGQKLFNCQRTDGETALKCFSSAMEYIVPV